ncbi:MAG: S-layer family protein, partial [Polaromonas sp.]|nr:S-layer family protein [Polaromonas sp.]
DEQLQGALQAEPKILAGNNLILKNVGNLRNEYGSITAGQNVTIGNADPLGSYQTASVINIGAVLNRNTVVDEYSIFRWNRSYGTSTSQSLAPQASTAVLSRVSGTMSAGGTFSINATTVTNTNALPGQSSVAGPASPGPAGAAFSLPALGALVIPPLTGPGQRYLIESDPRFTSYRQWLSSDYMLTALNTDPTLIQKRLGDGFYEQKLIRDQVGQLTGRRFLDGYTSEEAQYQALMASGVTVAQQWNLRPGIALTAAQISQLTSDIVWLVEQTVTLSDGSKTQAWVPVVYLSQTHTADLHPTGALISGKSVSIAAKGDLTNRGTLQAQDSILLAANKVTNELGLIDASRGSTTIVSDTDIINRSGMISGNSVQLDAARDIQIDAVTRQFSINRQTIAGNATGSNTEVGPQGSVVSRGDLAINAGRDIKVAGALVSAQGNASLNAGANLVVDTIQTQQSTQDVSGVGVRRTQGTTNLGSTLQTGGSLALSSGADTTLRAAQIGVGQDLSVIANGNLNILAATDTAQLDENIRAKGYVRNDHTAQERVVGSNLVAGGNVTLAALQTAPDGSKGNITVQGSSVNAVTGQLNVVAANNVNIIEAREKGEYDLFNETKGSKTFSSKTQTAHDTGSSDIAVGSALSGREISIFAGKDLTDRGSSVVSDNKTTLLATNNITIDAAKNFETSTTFREEKKSGLMSSGGIGFTVGSKQQSTDQQNTRTTASASTVGSIAGNVTATAGNNYRQVGSDVLTPAGNVTISAQKVDIVEARETTRSATEEKFKQSGVTFSVGSPIISAIQGAQNMAQVASQASDGRMQALAVATTALNLYSNQKEIGDAAKALASGDVSSAASISISLGSSKSQNNSSSASDSARGSSITAGGDVTISALGAGQASNITVQGSTITAGNNAKLLADN